MPKINLVAIILLCTINFLKGQCVDDGDCPGLFCDLATLTCVECLVDSDCPLMAGFVGNCDQTIKVCDYVLPIELLEFQGKVKSDIIELNWTTATEINNAGFEIQKSIDGKNWTKQNFIDGKGTTALKQTYMYEDLYPSRGSNLYRLKQIDFDGIYTYSKIILFDYFKFSNSVQVFPNPTRGYINLHIDNPYSRKIKIKLSDSMGKQILENEITQNQLFWEHRIDLIKPGVYFISVKSGANYYVRRVVVL